MVNDTCKWGVIGSSGVVEEFLSSLKHTNRHVAKGIYSTNGTRARSLAKQYQVDCFESIEELVDSPHVDSIYVASPNSLHFENARQALLARKNVLIEKPCCINSRQVMELLDIAKHRNVHVSENMWICHLPGIQELVNQIRKGEIGEITSIDIYVGFDSLGRRLSMSKRNVVLRNALLKIWPRSILNVAVPRNMEALDRNNFLESVPHFSRQKMQGALMDFGIYGLSIIQLITSDSVVIDVKSRKLNGIDVWTSVKLRDKNSTLRLSCSLFLSERNFIRVKGAKGFLYLQNMFEPTHFTKDTVGKSAEVIVFPPVGPRFVSLLNDFEAGLKDQGDKNLVLRDILSTYKLLDEIKSKCQKNS